MRELTKEQRPDPFFDACEVLILLPDGGPWSPAVSVVDWRMRERMKTVALALVLALNLGVDPPDVVRPCPRVPELFIGHDNGTHFFAMKQMIAFDRCLCGPVLRCKCDGVCEGAWGTRYLQVCSP